VDGAHSFITKGLYRR